MCGPQVRFRERPGGTIPRAYSTCAVMRFDADGPEILRFAQDDTLTQPSGHLSIQAGRGTRQKAAQPVLLAVATTSTPPVIPGSSTLAASGRRRNRGRSEVVVFVLLLDLDRVPEELQFALALGGQSGRAAALRFASSTSCSGVEIPPVVDPLAISLPHRHRDRLSVRRRAVEEIHRRAVEIVPGVADVGLIDPGH